MREDLSTIEASLEAPSRRLRRPETATCLALVVLWARKEVDRIGEVALLDGPQILGRGEAQPDDDGARARFVRQRPGVNEPAPALAAKRISRIQLRLIPRGDHLDVESVGLCPMRISGEPTRSGEARLGDTIHLQNEMVLLVARRPATLPEVRHYPHARAFAFGDPDPHGLVGESPAVWRLREQLALAGEVAGHVLVLGASGVGKELAASAVHALSPRASRPLVARNAATIPEGLIDAELFGNVRNYPNPGMPERLGLIGEADGSSLLLDEIGELPERLQAHLLRVLDRGGEYHRLGEVRARRADLRVIAATNRRIDELKHDLAARFPLRVEVPPLSARPEDVPLLVRHLLRRSAAAHPRVLAPFMEQVGGGGTAPRLAPELVERLVRHPYRLHTRELEQLLWEALTSSTGNTVMVPVSMGPQAAPSPPAAPPPLAPVETAPERTVERPRRRRAHALDRPTVEACLTRTDNNVTRAARELGLKNRYVLYRLMRKLGIEVAADRPASAEHPRVPALGERKSASGDPTS